MKSILMWVAILILGINAAYNWIKEDDDGINYDLFIQERDKIHAELKEISTHYKHEDEEINRINAEETKRDSIIDDSNKPNVRELFNDFDRRTR